MSLRISQMRHLALFNVIGLSLCGCGDSLSPTVDIEGERVLYQHSGVLTPCGGNVEDADNFVGFIDLTYGVFVDGLIQYRWLSESAFEFEARPGATYAYTEDRIIRTKNPSHHHELVHAVLFANGRSLPFLEEGLAEVHQQFDLGYSSRFLPGSFTLDPGDFLTQTDTDFPYNAAHAFVAYLLAEYGTESVYSVYDRVEKGDSEDLVEQIFEDELSKPLSVILDEYRDFSSLAHSAIESDEDFCVDYPPKFPVDRFECGAPRVEPTSEGKWEYQRNLRCDDPDVVGGVSESGPGIMRYGITVEIEEAGLYQVDYTDTSGQLDGVRMGSCAGCPWALDVIFIPDMGGHISDVRYFEPGLYYIQFMGRPASAVDFQLSLSRQ